MDAIRRVLACVDFSELTDRVLDITIAVAKQLGAEVHVAHALESPVRGVGVTEISVPTRVFEEARELAGRKLEEARAHVEDEGLEAVSHLVEAPASPALAKLAEEIDAQLVVIATRGRTGLSHVLLGSVAERVVRLAPCPVLTVK